LLEEALDLIDFVDWHCWVKHIFRKANRWVGESSWCNNFSVPQLFHPLPNFNLLLMMIF